MIIVAGTVAVAPEQHAAMVRAVTRLTAPTRTEDGCVEFEFWADLERRGRFHVFEVWASADHFAGHLATPHLKAFREERTRLGAQVALKRFEAEELRLS